jgi:Lon-like ATP-dependent protease
MLERKLDTIFRKVALKVVRDHEANSNSRMIRSVEVQENELVEYVGQPVFQAQRMYDETPIGVVMGLAWNTMGGSTLYIEAASVGSGEGKRPGLKITGNMKDVMKESTQIALSCAKIKLNEWASNIKFLDTHELHLHVPEGATPKDGPSAGCTMVTALLSLALNRPVRNDLAMTGEISLTGRILPVGGIREKLIAARREGVTCLVLPKGNEHDFNDLPGYLRDGLEVHFADHYDDVFDVAFCEDGDLTF